MLQKYTAIRQHTTTNTKQTTTPRKQRINAHLPHTKHNEYTHNTYAHYYTQTPLTVKKKSTTPFTPTQTTNHTYTSLHLRTQHKN